jgi:hypothetical protein
MPSIRRVCPKTSWLIEDSSRPRDGVSYDLHIHAGYLDSMESAEGLTLVALCFGSSTSHCGDQSNQPSKEKE